MAKTLHTVLTRRERQIMDILYRRGSATAIEVMDELPGKPSCSTVRTQLRVLKQKGHVRQEEYGLRERVLSRGAEALCKEVCAAAPRRHVLRRFRRKGGRRGSRRRRRAALGGSAGSHRRDGRESKEGRPMINLSLIVLSGFAVARCLRHQSAATRHWVLLATLICAASLPVLERAVPAWQLPAPLSLFTSSFERVNTFAGDTTRAVSARIVAPVGLDQPAAPPSRTSPVGCCVCSGSRGSP